MNTERAKKDNDRGRTLGYRNLSLIWIALVAIPLSVYLASGLSLFDVRETRLTTTIVSFDPLIIYLEDFLSASEVKYLKQIAQEKYVPSKVVDENNKKLDKTSFTRRSSSAFLPRQDDVVKSVIARAARFQGFAPTNHFENIQATKYVSGQEYMPHYDVFSAKPSLYGKEDGSENATERLSTMFVILEDSCGTHCGTQFPQIAIDWASEDPRWCEFVDCAEKRLTFPPRAGNAIFWKNLREDGSLHEDTLHAGLPLQHGAKIGLNIWMRNGIYPHVST
ncbi:2OG-Fe(II)oxygenase [Colletotrichum higginsianum IMI 349063]|uniref:2OG-Fe(II)oxygenase n=3 Tax=Colletotrichum higginsianum TaxID=80884 RepID=A0A1B7YW37_COLHI|nr:2OG-Fe(II)oxygenase [Colletotrichum higginsianum IMI 349063]OBR16257.1 2OG-Fe(II)oxygenase [Colletotrichum higginsianum IMI 349063]TID04425.1 putative prolyl 4-hydroxylase 3 [Colletotrichum higginsianum]GJC91496.1 2OG-Fe(II)oxygenase [Colletotrichum higginsianum]